MNYDFYAKHYDDKNPKLDWYQYAITKCERIGDTKYYSKSIKNYYKKKQISKTWKHLDLFSPNIKYIPKNSFLIKIKFKLKKHVISKGDEQFWPNKENPLCKEKVFKIPMLKASSIKGVLRFVVRKKLGEKSKIEKRLFGNEKEFEDHNTGRLNFYPIFFKDIDLDVIAPHDRKTRTAKQGISPIYLETVPPDTKGKLFLLYYPFDILGDKGRINKESKKDLELVDSVIEDMLTKYGIGAKTSDGYGTAEILEKTVNVKVVKDLSEVISVE